MATGGVSTSFTKTGIQKNFTECFLAGSSFPVLDSEQTSQILAELSGTSSQASRCTPENKNPLICSKNQKKRRRLHFENPDTDVDEGASTNPSKAKKSKANGRVKPSFIVKSKEMRAFFSLLDDNMIGSFLAHDRCRRISDKYLLAMTFAYFKRANFSIREYNRINFFRALYLANTMEEDEEDMKYEVFPWALGPNWQLRYPNFLLKRDQLWKRIGYRAVVSRKCCEEVMAIEPDHVAWKRVRPEHHGGAQRDYMRDPEDTLFPQGPYGSPRPCFECDGCIEYDSASPDDSISWYISSQDSSPGSPFKKVIVVKTTSRFDMEDLKETLPDDLIWAHGEE